MPAEVGYKTRGKSYASRGRLQKLKATFKSTWLKAKAATLVSNMFRFSL